MDKRNVFKYQNLRLKMTTTKASNTKKKAFTDLTTEILSGLSFFFFFFLVFLR